MENFNILSAGGFMFFLLILSVWYIVVEIILWKSYPFRKHIKRNDKSVLDRFIHYIIIWIFTNVWFFYLLYFTESYINFIEMFNNGAWIWKLFQESFGINILSFQIIWFSHFYFITLVLLLFLFRFWIPRSMEYFLKNYKNFYRKVKKRSK